MSTSAHWCFPLSDIIFFFERSIRDYSHSPYSEDRVRKGADKLIKMMNAKQQGRLDGFFTVQAKSDEKGKGPKPKVGTKRKVMSKIQFIMISFLLIFTACFVDIC